jgi:hypothetical protein
VIALYSSAVILKKGEGKPWSNLLAEEDETVQLMPQPSPSAAPSLSPSARSERRTPDVWELQYNSRQSLFRMPDKTLQYYPPDFAVPIAIRCRLEYRPTKPTILVVYIPDQPFGLQSKEVAASARFVVDNLDEIVNSIVADARSDKTNEITIRGRVIKANRVVFYHTPRITARDVGIIVNLGIKKSVVVERYGPKADLFE